MPNDYRRPAHIKGQLNCHYDNCYKLITQLLQVAKVTVCCVLVTRLDKTVLGYNNGSCISLYVAVFSWFKSGSKGQFFESYLKLIYFEFIVYVEPLKAGSKVVQNVILFSCTHKKNHLQPSAEWFIV